MLYDNILVPYDGSASAQIALGEAARFAKEDPGLTLRIIQITDPQQLAINKLENEGRSKEALSSGELHNLFQEALQEADAELHRQIDHMLKGLMNKIVIEFLEETVPGNQIITYAKDNNCDLIVMGSRGLGALRGMLGSVSSHVIRNASVPVLITRHPDDR